MRNRTINATLAVLALLVWSAPVRAQDDLSTTLEGIERNLWEAWKDADWDVFRANLVEDAVNNGAGGVMAGRDAMLSEMAGSPCEVAGYSLGDFQVHRVAAGTAILTYRAEQQATCDGETLPSPVWVSAVYVNEGGTWKNALYQETPAR